MLLIGRRGASHTPARDFSRMMCLACFRFTLSKTGLAVTQWENVWRDGFDIVPDQMETYVNSQSVSILGFTCSQAAR